MDGRPQIIGPKGSLADDVAPPSIKAVPFLHSRDHGAVELLNPREQRELGKLSSIVRVRRQTVIYPEGGRSQFVFNLVQGVAQTYHLLESGQRRVTSFMFPGDLLGLSENGHYAATAQALTNLTAYRIPIDAFRSLLERDPALDGRILCKLCHELRSSERHTIMASQRDAISRLAGFLLGLSASPGAAQAGAETLRLPMLRHDIADYLGLTVEAVSRAFQSLEAQGAVHRQTPRVISILDEALLQRLAQW